MCGVSASRLRSIGMKLFQGCNVCVESLQSGVRYIKNVNDKVGSSNISKLLV